MLNDAKGFLNKDFHREALAFLDRGEKIHANAKTDIEHKYAAMADSGKLLPLNQSIVCIIDNHASLLKVLSIVCQPPSLQIKQVLQKKMKVCHNKCFVWLSN